MFARDSKLRVASGRGLLCWMDVKPEFDRCLRWRCVGRADSGCSGEGKRSSGQGMYIASRENSLEEICGALDGKGTQLVGERFSWPVEMAEAGVIDTTGAALRENDIRALDGALSEEGALSGA